MISRNKDSDTIRFLEKALFGNNDDQSLLGKNISSSEKARKESSELQRSGFSKAEKEAQDPTEDALLGISKTLLERTKREEKHAEAVGQESIDTEDWKEIKPAKKLNNSEALHSRFADTILSAGASGNGGISNMGGPSKQLGCQTHNSIFDHEVLDRIAKTKSNHEKTTEEKEETERYRNSLKQSTLDEMVSAIKNTDLRKDSTVTNIGEYASSEKHYNLPKNNISIFDVDKDFARVPEKTDGEIDKELSRKPKEKDDSWKEVKSAKKINSVLDTFFNQLNEKD